MDQSFLETVVERLEHLEQECGGLKRQARRWRRAGGFAVVLSLVFLIGGAIQDKPPEPIRAERIEAQQFVLKDGKGETLAVLGDWGRWTHEVYLRFVDEHGKRIDIGTDAGNAVVKLYGKGQKVRFMVNVPPDGAGTIQVFDKDNKAIIPKTGE